MKRFILSILACATVSNSLLAQEGVTTREPKWKQVGQAYGFVVAQAYSLNRIATEYPDLAPEVRRATFEFSSTALGEGANALEDVLKQELGDEWPATKVKLEEQFLGIVEKMVPTRETAVQGIEEIRERAKGNMPESIRNTLLANCPAYVKSPGSELSAGWRQNFSTLKHPKSAGADITIGLPLSWRKRESTREGVVQVFRSGAGNGPILCTISCVKALDDADGELSADDMKELFTDAFIKEALPDGATLIEGRPMIIAGKTGSMSVFDVTQEDLDVQMKMRFTTFTIAHKQHIIYVNFQIMGQFLNGMTFDDAQKAYFPTYRSIMSTLVRN
jgi:hypothetical protein